MYYILNQAGQIVAVDPQMLSHLNISDINELYKNISLGEISVALDNDQVTLSRNGNESTYSATKIPLEGVLGDLALVVIDADSKSDAITEEKAFISYPEENESPAEAHTEDETFSFDDNILFELKEPEPEPESEEKTITESPIEEKTDISTDDLGDELFDLIIPTDADNAIAEIEEEKNQGITPSHSAEENSPIYIDIESISQKIGISTDDYNLFLNEYIDTALTLEEALQSNRKEEQKEALHKLSHLSNVLHLPYVDDLLKQIEESPEEVRSDKIASFFSTLGRLTTSRFEEETSESVLEEIPQTEKVEKKEETAQVATRTPIDLSNVKPIHFDFQLEEAAKDLSLPVELIEEFVNDFISQAHEETEKMLAAYEKGDLETIQKIGHLLKGTSSNLRINPLAETLYEIQFNDDLDRVPELVRNYWGHFLSLEKQINLISKK